MFTVIICVLFVTAGVVAAIVLEGWLEAAARSADRATPLSLVPAASTEAAAVREGSLTGADAA